jgi:hypothetical protein
MSRTRRSFDKNGLWISDEDFPAFRDLADGILVIGSPGAGKTSHACTEDGERPNGEEVDGERANGSA